MHRILAQPGAKQALTRLKPGTELAFDLPVNGELRTFRYDRDDTHRVELALRRRRRSSEKVIERPTETRTVVLSGKVGQLAVPLRRASWACRGSNINTLTDEIFKYDIDFNEDVGANDRFSVVVEQIWREGELISTGPVQAATFTVGGKLHSGFRFERNGKAEYFTADGRPLKKSFIRMPIPYARLTSSFGARRHPVLGRMRMHKGVDYAARHRHADHGRRRCARAVRRLEGRLRPRGDPRPRPRLHHAVRAHVALRQDQAGQRIAQGTVIGYVGMHRPGDRPAPALRIPRQRRAPQSAVDHDAAAGAAERRGAGAVPRPDRLGAGADPEGRAT